MDDSKRRGPCDSKSNRASRESMKLSKRQQRRTTLSFWSV